MPDLEKVIRGLKCHMADPDGSLDCIECPYSQRSDTYIDNSAGCLNRLHADALALLKEQEPVKPIIEHGKMYPQCGNCGEWLLKSDKYCSACGRKVLWE